MARQALKHLVEKRLDEEMEYDTSIEWIPQSMRNGKLRAFSAKEP